MLSSSKLLELCRGRKISIDELAGHLVRGGLDKASAARAIKNWQRGLFKPTPTKEDITALATALGVEENAVKNWSSSYKYAPGSSRKARLSAELIVGRDVQDALDLLKFANKRHATMLYKVLKSAIASADEQQANVENLYVAEARVDEAGRRLGTKQWIAKDRGRAHAIIKRACHLHVTVTEA
jgi:large subunit ribosomal protein L22